eukprot:10571102-Ditylum_brightwellii.AAC.1
MDKSFKVIFTDVSAIDNELSFQCYKRYMAACDELSSFAAIEGLEMDKLISTGDNPVDSLCMELSTSPTDQYKQITYSHGKGIVHYYKLRGTRMYKTDFTTTISSQLCKRPS